MRVLAHAFNAAGPRAWLLWLGLALLLGGALRVAGVGRRWIPEWGAVIAVASGVALAAIGNAHTESPARVSRPETTGSVRITAPSDEATIAGGDTAVEVDVADFVLVTGTSRGVRPGYGHLHLMVDGILAPLSATPGAGRHDVCVPAGRHTITAVLVAEDHAGWGNEVDVTHSVAVTARTGEC